MPECLKTDTRTQIVRIVSLLLATGRLNLHVFGTEKSSYASTCMQGNVCGCTGQPRDASDEGGPVKDPRQGPKEESRRCKDGVRDSTGLHLTMHAHTCGSKTAGIFNIALQYRTRRTDQRQLDFARCNIQNMLVGFCPQGGRLGASTAFSLPPGTRAWLVTAA